MLQISQVELLAAEVTLIKVIYNAQRWTEQYVKSLGQDWLFIAIKS